MSRPRQIHQESTRRLTLMLAFGTDRTPDTMSGRPIHRWLLGRLDRSHQIDLQW